ncbi:MAG TPA: hypothetical protein VHI52_15040 [Verrucomicrobiae bacterium]|nr:hypothetical protein [Verrucomicrobiae bacterium]
MNASGARLEAITRELRLQWLLTKESWDDAKSREFEQKYLQELFAAVDRSVATIDELDKLITKIRKDCE